MQGRWPDPVRGGARRRRVVSARGGAQGCRVVPARGGTWRCAGVLGLPQSAAPASTGAQPAYEAVYGDVCWHSASGCNRRAPGCHPASACLALAANAGHARGVPWARARPQRVTSSPPSVGPLHGSLARHRPSVLSTARWPVTERRSSPRLADPSPHIGPPQHAVIHRIGGAAARAPPWWFPHGHGGRGSAAQGAASRGRCASGNGPALAEEGGDEQRAALVHHGGGSAGDRAGAAPRRASHLSGRCIAPRVVDAAAPRRTRLPSATAPCG
ncbi:hypothetical protein FM106_08925 [Brachybacterium faecium]|nr:hypothetical protein FM106_08925 [Brachybacterium faecium]